MSQKRPVCKTFLPYPLNERHCYSCSIEKCYLFLVSYSAADNDSTKPGALAENIMGHENISQPITSNSYHKCYNSFTFSK